MPTEEILQEMSQNLAEVKQNLAILAGGGTNYLIEISSSLEAIAENVGDHSSGELAELVKNTNCLESIAESLAKMEDSNGMENLTNMLEEKLEANNDNIFERLQVISDQLYKLNDIMCKIYEGFRGSDFCKSPFII